MVRQQQPDRYGSNKPPDSALIEHGPNSLVRAIGVVTAAHYFQNSMPNPRVPFTYGPDTVFSWGGMYYMLCAPHPGRWLSSAITIHAS